MKLGVDVYSIRSQGWTAHQYLDYCRQIGLNVVHFSDLEPFESLDDSYLRSLKAHADDLGLLIEAGMGSICPTSTTFSIVDGLDAVGQMTRMLHIASILGSPVVRCLLGANADRRTPTPLQAHIEGVVATCKAVRAQAMDLGIKIAIENHSGDLQGWELRRLIEEAGTEYVGACIDTGSPLWVHEDPAVTLEHLAPYVVTTHIRDSAVWPHPRGAAVQWVAMGDGNMGIEQWAARYKTLCPHLPFTLEIITGIATKVLNYLEDDYWTAYPQSRAAEFARFERLVRRGAPYMGTVVTIGQGEPVPPEYEAARVAQERYDLERSVAYCRQVLGMGE